MFDPQVNIPYTIQKPIEEELQETISNFEDLVTNWEETKETDADSIQLARLLTLTLFDRAKQHVYKLLKDDPYERWRAKVRSKEMLDAQGDGHDQSQQ